MGKIVLEIEEFGKTHAEYRIFDQESIQIGRAFNNDLIINDPFVAAAHLSLKFTQGAWMCGDNKSLNGTFVTTPPGKTKVKIEESHPINSGDKILLGKSVIHVWDINHVVAPEQAIDNRSTLFWDSHNTAGSLIFVLSAFCFLTYLYLSQWAWERHYTFSQISVGICFILFCFIIWSAVWALITRFSCRQHRFLNHLIFSLQWFILICAITFVFQYVTFFICDNGFYHSATLLIFSLFCIFIISTHLAIGTNLRFTRRVLISGLIAFSIICLLELGFYAMRNDFNPNPPHYIDLAPVPKSFIPAIPINEEIHRLDKLF